jgi:hypothetical protein
MKIFNLKLHKKLVKRRKLTDIEWGRILAFRDLGFANTNCKESQPKYIHNKAIFKES